MLKALPKWNIESIEKEAMVVANMIKRMPEVKEVVLECSYREAYK